MIGLAEPACVLVPALDDVHAAVYPETVLWSFEAGAAGGLNETDPAGPVAPVTVTSVGGWGGGGTLLADDEQPANDATATATSAKVAGTTTRCARRGQFEFATAQSPAWGANGLATSAESLGGDPMSGNTRIGCPRPEGAPLSAYEPAMRLMKPRSACNAAWAAALSVRNWYSWPSAGVSSRG